MRKLVFALISLIAIGAVAAADINTVILATDTNTPDLYAASAAGANEGAPVLVTEDGALTEGIKDELLYLGANEVIIVGGPVAVSTDVEDELKDDGYEVVRIAGATATGTAVELAEYMFPDEIDCAVLVEDTENPDEDWENQMDASNLATEEGCPMIPVPGGDIPSSVLEFLENRNITRVRYVARTIRSEVRDILANFDLTEVVGTRGQVRSWIRNRIVNHTAERIGDKPMIVVIAAPFWNDSLSFGSRPMEYSVVWRIAGTDEIPALVDYINDNNITTVKVQGIPWLATEIVDQLTNLSIDVSQFSAERAWEVTNSVLNRIKTAWRSRMLARRNGRATVESAIRNRIWERINSSENQLNALEAEVESMAAEGIDVTSINATLQQAKARIGTAKTTISYDWYRSRQLVAQTVKDVWMRAWRNNVSGRLLNIAERVRDETEGITSARERLNELESEMRATLITLATTCDRPLLVRRLVDRAKDLKDTVVTEIQAGNYGRAAMAVGSAQELLRMAKSLEVLCTRYGTITPTLQNAVDVSTSFANNTLTSISAVSG